MDFPKHSGEVEWNVKDEEVFRFLHGVFDVRLAKQFIAKNPRPLRTIRPDTLKQMSFLIHTWSRAEINLSIPVVIGDFGTDMIFPIDGWNRINLALKEKIECLPAVLLTKNESRKVWVNRPRRFKKA